MTFFNELSLHGDLWEDIFLCVFRVVEAIPVLITGEMDEENEVNS